MSDFIPHCKRAWKQFWQDAGPLTYLAMAMVVIGLFLMSIGK
jgi:hypothetical protein